MDFRAGQPLQRHALNVASALLLLSVLPHGVHAQASPPEVDSAVALLDSPNWRVRADALDYLTNVPDSLLPPSYHPKVVALLNQEALHPVDDSTVSGEMIFDYESDLVREALSFKDPAALQGFAYLGIQMARVVKEFVAEQGSSALPYLDGAWRADTDARTDIMTTWGLMVGRRYRSRITAAERIALLARLLQAADSEPIGFISAALAAPLSDATPVMEAIADGDAYKIVRAYAQEAMVPLTAHRDSLSPPQLHVRLSDWLRAICLNAAGDKAATCGSLTRLLAAGPTDTHGLLRFQMLADSAYAAGTFTRYEHALLSGNAARLVSIRGR